MVYFPHPGSKIRHFQPPSVIEVLAEFIPHLAYSGCVDLLLHPEKFLVTG